MKHFEGQVAGACASVELVTGTKVGMKQNGQFTQWDLSLWLVAGTSPLVCGNIYVMCLQNGSCIFQNNYPAHNNEYNNQGSMQV